MINKYQYSYQVPLKVYNPIKIPGLFTLTLSKSMIRSVFTESIDLNHRYGILVSIKLGKRRIWSAAWYVQTVIGQAIT